MFQSACSFLNWIGFLGSKRGHEKFDVDKKTQSSTGGKVVDFGYRQLAPSASPAIHQHCVFAMLFNLCTSVFFF